MIKTVLKYVLILIVLSLVIGWLWAGGWTRIANFVRTIPNPIDIIWGNSTSTYAIMLPWQTAVPQGPDITGLTDQYTDNGNSGDTQSTHSTQYLHAPSGQYSSTAYGVPSPYRGSVTLSEGRAKDTQNEYVELHGQGAPISLQGWSLASGLSGARVYIPLAAHPFILGTVNAVAPVTLSSGVNAFVYTARSPVGASFRENRCTGYLAQTQSFDPSLANACPSPSEAMPTNAENLRRYGSDCIDYVRTLPQCTFPTTAAPNLSPACRAYVSNTFSYNGCVYQNLSDPSFGIDTWRLYVASGVELWKNSHDVILLIDAEGRTVDSLTY